MSINIENVLWTSLGAKTIQFIYCLVIAFTIGNDPDCIYWALSIVTVLPMVLLAFPIYMMMRNEGPKTRAGLQVSFFCEIIISCMVMA